MVVFGHQGSVLTLWDSSKRVLTNSELKKLQDSITRAEIDKID